MGTESCQHPNTENGGNSFIIALLREAFSDHHLALPDFILKVYLVVVSPTRL